MSIFRRIFIAIIIAIALFMPGYVGVIIYETLGFVGVIVYGVIIYGVVFAVAIAHDFID